MANTQIYQVLPGRPFGRGRYGSITLASDPHVRRRGTGTSGTKTLTLSSGAYANGDLIVIKQMTGSSHLTSTAENWEINYVVSGGGTTTLTLLNNLSRNYSGAEVLDLKEYINLTISSFTITGWNTSNQFGGSIAVAALGVTTWSGAVSGNGTNGNVTGSDTGGTPSDGGGYKGGWISSDASNARQGEGWPGVGSELQTANGNGGGGALGNAGAGKNPGGGGGNGSAGQSIPTNGGNGGDTAGNTALTSFFLGGGGGGADTVDATQPAGSGANGGGGFMGWFNKLNTITGSLNLNGGVGGNGTDDADGGSGAGGSCLLNVGNGAIGTNKITANGGSASGFGGAGGAGRVRINYGAVITGSSSPSASTAHDPYLVAGSGGSFLSSFV